MMNDIAITQEQSDALAHLHADEPEGLARGIPAAPVLGHLPLARIVPQEVRSVVDYACGALVAGGALLTACPKARAASLILGGTGALGAGLADHRFGIAKVVPIETSEKLDHLWGISAIALPFALGYWKTAPRVAAGHVLAGVAKLAIALVTDYRASRGIGRHLRTLEG
jgi:hypothetical protein